MQKVSFKCDSCGKENRIRSSCLCWEEIRAIENNRGCYCSKCKQANKKEGISYMVLAGEMFSVYPNIVTVDDVRGVKRAKDILKRGLEQTKNQ